MYCTSAGMGLLIYSAEVNIYTNKPPRQEIVVLSYPNGLESKDEYNNNQRHHHIIIHFLYPLSQMHTSSSV
jgi:hypothetical protein